MFLSTKWNYIQNWKRYCQFMSSLFDQNCVSETFLSLRQPLYPSLILLFLPKKELHTSREIKLLYFGHYKINGILFE